MVKHWFCKPMIEGSIPFASITTGVKMNKYTEESIQRVRDESDIVDVFNELFENEVYESEYAIFELDCPFHDDSYGSMVISGKFQRFYCFECGAKGDVIDILMSHKLFGFNEAIDYLATRYDIPIEIDGPKLTRTSFSDEVPEHILDYIKSIDDPRVIHYLTRAYRVNHYLIRTILDSKRE